MHSQYEKTRSAKLKTSSRTETQNVLGKVQLYNTRCHSFATGVPSRRFWRSPRCQPKHSDRPQWFVNSLVEIIADFYPFRRGWSRHVVNRLFEVPSECDLCQRGWPMYSINELVKMLSEWDLCHWGRPYCVVDWLVEVSTERQRS